MVIWTCLLAAFLGPLLVPLYVREQPRLGGLPLFYWSQLIWIPLSAFLLVSAYFLARRRERAGQVGRQ
ncbi:DUF3311 domain-containing protein [Microtetraspora sp. NBRC 16547]|uniref:DUF3311 domain-containing protein n=1 Tax=Microtetraspora sp. NBRC 16547 TaxID=3030993 RepID=UPI0025547D7B|nr:DUF3311 domain-containing protein [Microtetraspora sp. NBRC 16547]